MSEQVYQETRPAPPESAEDIWQAGLDKIRARTNMRRDLATRIVITMMTDTGASFSEVVDAIIQAHPTTDN